MREIKFRQILKPSLRGHSGSFHYWGYIDGGFIAPVGKNHFVEGSKDQQYTGKKGNGVEIYEGDIIRTFEGDIVQVKWDDTDALFSLANDEIDNLLDSIGGCEVIGNIYETPEYND